jgi:tellurite resistance protein
MPTIVFPKNFPGKRPGLWRATPPAIFPPILGLLGLGLAWRRAGVVFGIGPAISDLILGAVSLLALFALAAYGAKVAQRPGVVAEDLRVLPGRAGLAAATLSVMLLAVVALAYAPGLGLALLWLGFALHAGLVAMIVRAMVTGPIERRRVTPVWHLSFAGFILAPLSATPLGFYGFSTTVLFLTLAMAMLIWVVSAQQFAKASVPAPLRPLLAVHLVPASLLATVAAELLLPILAQGMGVLALLIALGLIAAARWLTAAGFSPMWGAFTFPMAAFASAALSLSGFAHAGLWRLPGGVMLVAASLAIPVIAAKVLQLWAKGQLGPRTNAAIA